MELCDFDLDNYIQGTLTSEFRETLTVPAVAEPASFQWLSQGYRIMLDILNGVAYIHSLGEVHRDLKPRNGTILIIVTDEQFFIHAVPKHGKLLILD